MRWLGGSSLRVLERRAAPVAPNGYAPAQVACPAAQPTIRAATSLLAEESAWLPIRGNNTSRR